MVMRVRVGDLRKIIRQVIVEARKGESKYHFGGSHPDESYDKELLKDPAFDEESVYVPNDIKKKIKKWAKDMGLTSR